MNTVALATALLMGVFGGAHCIVMCGGVVAMTCAALPTRCRGKIIAQFPYVLAYNAGRIASYAVAGALSGAAGALFVQFAPVHRLEFGLRLAAGATMLAVGLYVAGVSRALRWVERIGEPLWRRVAPVAQRLVPVRSPAHALALGLLWGWMPCGLVYAALAASATSGSYSSGAMTMVAFGLGTLPTLVTMGSAAALLTRVARAPLARMTAGMVIVAFGLVQVLGASRAWAHGAGSGPPLSCACHR